METRHPDTDHDRSPADGAGGTSAPREGDAAYVAVTAATMWAGPDRARAMDAPSLATPADLDAWNRAMADTASRGWLLDHLESQALYGSRVIVDETREDWARIVAVGQSSSRDERGYPGWVPLAQLVADDAYGEALDARPYALVTADRAALRDVEGGSGAPEEAPFTTILPVLDDHDRGDGTVAVRLPGGATGRLDIGDVEVHAHGEGPAVPTADDVIATGERFLGLRYLWAGMTAYGLDCSGFVHAIHKRHGIAIARDAGDQMRHSGLAPVEREDLRRGDLVFFSTEPGATSIRHVAMYVGEGRILHAPNYERSVEVISLAEYDTRDEYAGAVRVLQP